MLDVTHKYRPAARILLVDESDRVLLLSNLLESKNCLIWVAPGGALEKGESYEDAVRRECWEETGLSIDGPLTHVWVREHRWVWDGVPIHTREHYFFKWVENFEPEAQELEDYEERLYRGCRWWSIEELKSSDELVVPRDIGDLLVPLCRGEVPEEPIEVGV